MPKNVNDFVKLDNPRSLFPLSLTKRYVELGEHELRNFIYESIFGTSKSVSFAACPSVYALKDKIHLRRMLLLDPVASFYMYDFVLDNCKLFKSQKKSERQYFGYAFEDGRPLSPFTQYHEFRKQKYQLKAEYNHFAKVDISNCFNNFYHHDIVSYLNSNLSNEKARQFGQFLREINRGRSINCFPQGIYPAKALGNGYLSFIETSRELKSPVIIRFLDDIFLFANKSSILEQDVVVLQQLLGSHALFLNREKTQFGSKKNDFEERKLDRIKISLLRKREEICGYDEEDEEDGGLVPKEVDYLKNIIKSNNVAEEDVELALSLLRQDKEGSSILIKLVFEHYPNLIKDLYRHLPEIQDDGELWAAIEDRVSSTFVSEFELFWLVRIILDIYKFDQDSVDLLLKIFEHPCASPIVQSAILEFTDNRFGFCEFKQEQLQSGAGGIIAISAIAGLEKLEKAKRNQLYKYVSKTSPYLHILCSIMLKAK